MAEHVLKTLPEYWDAVERGEKTFEVRRDDRGFQRGDTVTLVRLDRYASGAMFESHRRLRFTIGWVLTGGQLGLEPGFVAFSLQISAQERRSRADALAAEVERLKEERDEAKATRDTLIQAALIAAPHHQGGHSGTGQALATALEMPFPITMDNLVERACEAGLKPSELWPWLSARAALQPQEGGGSEQEGFVAVGAAPTRGNSLAL